MQDMTQCVRVRHTTYLYTHGWMTSDVRVTYILNHDHFVVFFSLKEAGNDTFILVWTKIVSEILLNWRQTTYGYSIIEMLEIQQSR